MGDLVENGKNRLEVRCKHCESIVLRPGAADFIDQPFDLPLTQQAKGSNPADASTAVQTESLSEFWTVSDMFTFENVGFSHSVDQVKFLVCADCELGPIGYHDIPTKRSFIALARVRHV